MTDTVVSTAPRTRSAPLLHSRLPGWTREPLLHFVVLGALLFGIDHYVITKADDPRTIVVGADVDREAQAVFKASRGRMPNATELEALRRVWLDNEVLYREGIALGVDKGDVAIRERVIFKALSVVDANTALPASDDASLRTWFEAHRAKYDEPARYDFQEAVLAGEPSESAVAAFVGRLNGHGEGDANAGLRVFKGRPLPNLDQAYGPDFAKALATSQPGVWQALRTRDGWRAIRLDAMTPPRPADFAALRTVVHQDWADATLAEQRSAAVRQLAKKYMVRHETTPR